MFLSLSEQFKYLEHLNKACLVGKVWVWVVGLVSHRESEKMHMIIYGNMLET